MIISFTIQNFKLFKDPVKLSFEASSSNELKDYYINEVFLESGVLQLLKIGIIYGPNASGKSTVLEALDLLRKMVLQAPKDKTKELVFSPFIFNQETALSSTRFEIEFIYDGIKYFYEVSFDLKNIHKESLYFYKPKKALVYERITDPDKFVSKIEFGSKIRIPKKDRISLEANTLSNTTVLAAYLKTNFELLELTACTSWFKNTLKPIVLPKTNLYPIISSLIEDERIEKAHVIEILRKADFNISDIRIKKNKTEITPDLKIALQKIVPESERNNVDLILEDSIETREIFFKHSFEASEANYLPYKDESLGTQRYYQFAGLLSLLIQRNAIIPIDEIEASLHPDLIKHFLLSFITNSSNSQVITTTHFREFLMERELYRDDVIWFTEKDETGKAELYSLADFDSGTIRNTSSVYNAYKSGKLGAIPNLNDYYINTEA